MSSFRASITIKLSKYPKINITIFAGLFYISVPSFNSTCFNRMVVIVYGIQKLKNSPKNIYNKNHTMSKLDSV